MPTTPTTPVRAPLSNTPRLQELRAQRRQPGEASFFFFDPTFKKESVKILPGEFFVSNEELVIATTLGSCIAACLWDRDKRIGGMNHFLLPDAKTGDSGSSGRYGAYAMDRLIGELIKRGANRSSMEAKIFGGAAVIDGMNTLNVGRQNTEFVQHYLHTERISIVSQDVMDIYPRKVCFLPVSGKAMVKRLAPATASRVVAQDRAAVQNTTPQIGGTVDLF